MNKTKFLPGLLLLSTLIILECCVKKVGYKIQRNVTCDSVTYKKDIEPIINTSCAKSGCHNESTQAGGVKLTSYEMVKIQADAGRIKARVIDGNPSYMPQDQGRLSEPEIKKIQCWLDKNAPNN